MLKDLSNVIQSETSDRFLLSRTLLSAQSLVKRRGLKVGALMATAMAVSGVYALASSYLLAEGSVRAFAALSTHSIVGIRPLGDAGGWIALDLFTALTGGTIFVRLVREGEYYRLKSICRRWIEKNRSAIEQDPKFKDTLYTWLHELLDAFQARCLFSKSVVSRHIMALQMCKGFGPKKRSSEFAADQQLQTIFKDIHAEIKVGSSQHMRCIREGQRAVRLKDGRLRQLGLLIMGLALPTILFVCTVCSLVGEVGLGKEVLADRKEVGDVGHLGEWPLNALEAFALAFFLYTCCMLKDGVLEIASQSYTKKIGTLREDPEAYGRTLHNRLCAVGDRELAQCAEACYYFNLPTHRFEKL